MRSIPTRFILGFPAHALGFALVAAGLSAQQQQPPIFGDGSAPAAQEQSGSSTAGGRARLGNVMVGAAAAVS